MKIRPPAVVVGPPRELGAPVLIPAGTPAMVPYGICQAMSPVFTSTAVRRPQGGAQQGQPLAENEYAENEIADWAVLGLVLYKIGD